MAGASHFRQLDCWQLANQLKRALYALSRREPVVHDFRFADQVRDAAASAPRNIAEGFGRRTHKEFAHFLDIARGSLNECQNHLIDSVDRGYLTTEEAGELMTLSNRALGALAGLQRHLRNTPDQLSRVRRRG